MANLWSIEGSRGTGHVDQPSTLRSSADTHSINALTAKFHVTALWHSNGKNSREEVGFKVRVVNANGYTREEQEALDSR